MRSTLFVLLVCLLLFPLPARAERATIEVAGGVGDATRTLIRQRVELGKEETTLWRVRSRLTLPLSLSFAAILSYERIGDGSGRLAYIEGNGTRVISRERYGLFEIGFRIALGRP